MESDKFDNLVRGAFEGASRRNVVRVGIGALAASALVTMGLRAEDADAKKKKKKKKKKPKPITCAGSTPVTCGAGCCPGTFSKCCQADVADNPPGTQTCNPTSFTCCPAELGGGSCSGGAPTCCPPTRNGSFAQCANATEKCCTAEQGGGTCESTETCCPPNTANPQDSGACCPAGQTCCITGGAACPTGQVCNGDANEAGCCVPAPPRTAPGANRRRNGAERFHMLAQ